MEEAQPEVKDEKEAGKGSVEEGIPYLGFFQIERRPEMFWKKKPATEEMSKPEAEKLPGPRSIEELVGRHLVVDLNQNPDWVWKLRSVVRRRTGGKHRFDFRVFDEAQAGRQKVKVNDWTTFDQHPELILYQGWFDKVSMEVHFEESKAA